MRTWVTCETVDDGEVMFPVEKVSLVQRLDGVEGTRVVLADGLGTHMLKAPFDTVVQLVQTS